MLLSSSSGSMTVSCDDEFVEPSPELKLAERDLLPLRYRQEAILGARNINPENCACYL